MNQEKDMDDGMGRMVESKVLNWDETKTKASRGMIGIYSVKPLHHTLEEEQSNK